MADLIAEARFPAPKYRTEGFFTKFEDITTADLLAFAAQNDIKNPAKHIDKVKKVLKDFRPLAYANGIAPLFIDIIESRLHELSPDVFAPAVVTSDLIRFELTDAGNIHLYATMVSE